MTLLNFPPTNGQPTDGSFTYTANGVIYAWDGEKWTANSEQGLDGNYVNIDGDTMTGDLTVPSLNGGPLAGLRNQLINGDFRIWQRGASFDVVLNSASDAVFLADRWATLNSGTHQRTNTAPDGFDYAITSDSLLGLRQYIELGRQGHNSQFKVGSTWTLSVWATGDLPASARTAPLFRGHTGSASGSTNTSIATIANWVSTGETSNGFTRYSSKIDITGGVAAGEPCIEVYVEIPANTSCTGIQLEPGPVATPFEHRPIGLELQLCQRYYQQVDFAKDGGYLYLTQLNPTSRAVSTMFPVEMRANPTPTATLSFGGVDNIDAAIKTLYIRSDIASGNASASYVTSFTADAELLNGF